MNATANLRSRLERLEAPLNDHSVVGLVNEARPTH